ncbi:MAG: hypothetical protein KAW45_02125 [Thermoplasmatales archaeon]|nr:hypothetical protein [Thermoplasmatales archaeon]
MKNNLFRKGLVLAIIILFVGASVIPSICRDIESKNIISKVKENKAYIKLESKVEQKISIYNPSEILTYENLMNDRWYKTFGGSKNDWGYSVQQTNDGGYIITGITRSYGAGDNDVWLIKTNSNGDEIWNKTFGGTGVDNGLSVQQTTDGGYIIAGWAQSNTTYWDFYLIKTYANGTEEWNNKFGGLDNDTANSCQQTTDGGYIIAGWTWSYGNGLGDGWLVKTDSNGQELWNKTFGGTSFDEFTSVQQTNDGGYIVVGRKDYHLWLVKTNNTGNKTWEKTMSEFSDGNSVQQTKDGGYIVTGKTSDSYDACLIKTDTDGNETWTKIFKKFSEGTSVNQTIDGGYIIAAWTIDDETGDSDLGLIKTDANGNETWNTTFGGETQEWGNAVKQTIDGGYIATGFTGPSSNWDVLLVKADENGQINIPPNEPDIEGPISGIPGTEYEYTFVTTDPEDGDLYYYIDWGDGTIEKWIGPYESGEEVTRNHNWNENGNYTIRAKAKDAYKGKSDWSAPFTVTIADNIPPTVKIIKPVKGLYIKNKMIRPFFIRISLIIGNITIEANATDDETGIEKVEFYAGLLGNILLGEDITPPYTFNWKRDRIRFIHMHILKVVAYDSAGNIASDKIIVRKFL